MKPFEYLQAADPASAVAIVSQRPTATFLAGGTNLVDHLKLGITSPDLLIDVSKLPLEKIEERADGSVRIGAMMRNSDLAAHPIIRERHPVLSEALLAGASAQLRNMATTGGNLLQRTRCLYFQDPQTPCNKRDPGTGCSALGGFTRNYAVLGASESCVAVNPSDMAVALAALDAHILILGPGGERTIPITEFHRLPGAEPQRDTVLEHGELITAVLLPPGQNSRSAYRKVRDRASFAFALVSVAAVVELEEDGSIHDVRLALGGVAHKPWRAERAEEILRGAAATEQNFYRAADAELETALALRDNAFKIPMARNTIVAVLRDLTGRQNDA